MTSSNGNIFRVTGPLCKEFTGHRWIPHTKASDVELWNNHNKNKITANLCTFHWKCPILLLHVYVLQFRAWTQRLHSNMMTSSNGNIFRVTGHLCGEFTGPRWIPRTHTAFIEAPIKRKHQSSASLAFVRGISRWSMDFPSQRPSNAENVSICDDVIMCAFKVVPMSYNFRCSGFYTAVL